jgi:hypothetical protein
VRDIDLKAISATENSNKFQKNPGFGRKKSVEEVATLGPTEQATLVFLKTQYFPLKKFVI